MQFITGGWAASILGAAARHDLFGALEKGATDANTPETAAFLTKDKPSYFGGMAEVMFQSLSDWKTLGEAAKTGQPTATRTVLDPDNEFWHVLVPAIAPLSFPVAQMAAEKLELAKKGAVRWLDVGGGSGVWSAAWLGVNKEARGTQLDWPVVNKIAKGFVGRFGVAERFETIDGDFHETDFGAQKYDYAIYGHIAHQESPASNIEIFKRFRKALKPGGTLLVNDFVLENDRTGHPFAMMFSSQMLLVSQEGAAWRRDDYRDWLNKAGFASVEFMPTPGPATVVFAR
jgi:ubiquinone/menaquinone biosynthesis C-methylase UbiE